MTRYTALEFVIADRGVEASAAGHQRGWPTLALVLAEGDENSWCDDWRYADDLTSTSVERPCIACGRSAEPGGPDPCLGMIPGVSVFP